MDTASPTNNKVNILLVDDRPENLVALRAVLTAPEHNLVTATSGAEALRAILREDFAVILLDVLMPEMDGFEVAALIKQREPSSHIPIIFLTAAGTDISFIYRGYSVGAVDYLVKPIDPDVVRAKVAVFVDLYRKGAEIRRQAELLRESQERERALQLAKLRLESEKRYQNLAEAIPHIVWVARPDGAVDYWTQRWFAFTGMSHDRAQGFGWLAAVHPEDVAALDAGWRAALAAGEDFEAEVRLRRRDGAHRWHLCRARPERDVHGEVLAWLGTYTDVDDLRRAEEERARLYLEAQAAVQARDEFLSTASHELRTPLAALALQVKSLLRLASKDGPTALASDKSMTRLHAMDRQVERLARLINNLLDVSRITEGRLELELEEVDLAAVVRDEVDRAREELAKAGCALEVVADRAVVGRWDKLRLEQVVTNLLSNALKYGAGRPIEVFVEAAGATARLRVRDHGIGIAETDQARIFERFERVVSARHIGGLGLGLWITRQIVAALRGEIQVESVPGEGSTFVVELPLAEITKEHVLPHASDAALVERVAQHA